MRALAVGLAALAALVAASSAPAEVGKRESTWQLRSQGASGFAVRVHSGRVSRSGLLARSASKAAARPSSPAAPAGPSAVLSAYESEVVRRINVIRASRGRRPLRVSRQLSAAAAFHTNQMGIRGFFEHESANGAPFWQRIERFYPTLPGRSWSVGENIVWGSPDLSPQAAVREWMGSPPHRENILSRQWREIGLGAGHFASAPRTFRGGPVTIVTADFGARA
jgi:uncharacterized protein YkwD